MTPLWRKAQTDTKENSQRDKLHQEKLKEVEELLMKENGKRWKCKTCKKISRDKDEAHRHAEKHLET